MQRRLARQVMTQAYSWAPCHRMQRCLTVRSIHSCRTFGQDANLATWMSNENVMHVHHLPVLYQSSLSICIQDYECSPRAQGQQFSVFFYRSLYTRSAFCVCAWLMQAHSSSGVSKSMHDCSCTYPCCCAGEDMGQSGGSKEEHSGSEADRTGPGKTMLEPAQAVAKPEVAHLGMQPRKALARRAKSDLGHKELSIAEQERLALSMLAQTR